MGLKDSRPYKLENDRYWTAFGHDAFMEELENHSDSLQKVVNPVDTMDLMSIICQNIQNPHHHKVHSNLSRAQRSNPSNEAHIIKAREKLSRPIYTFYLLRVREWVSKWAPGLKKLEMRFLRLRT